MNEVATAIVADDETNLREYLRKRLGVVWPGLQILGEAANGREALALIEQTRPDVAFLDIKMPGLTGLEVAARMPPETRVVFVTAFDEFALEAFEKAAVDYLLKPVDDDRLRQTVERLQSAGTTPKIDMAQLIKSMSDLKSSYLSWLRVGSQGETRIVPVADVVFFQAEHKYTTVRTVSAEHLIRKSIKELETELDPGRFWRVHRSTLVNLDYIDVARRDLRGRFTLHLKGLSQTLKVSDTYSHLFRQM